MNPPLAVRFFAGDIQLLSIDVIVVIVVIVDVAVAIVVCPVKIHNNLCNEHKHFKQGAPRLLQGRRLQQPEGRGIRLWHSGRRRYSFQVPLKFREGLASLSSCSWAKVLRRGHADC